MDKSVDKISSDSSLITVEEAFGSNLIESLDDNTLIKVETILANPEYLKRREFVHHGDFNGDFQSVVDYSINVAKSGIEMALNRNFNKKQVENVAIGGLLHDFYSEDWHKTIGTTTYFEQHGYNHPLIALDNARKEFPDYMNYEIEDAIVKHMFPMNLIKDICLTRNFRLKEHKPSYPESWTVWKADKKDSLKVLSEPKTWPQYLGIKSKVKKS